MISKRTICGFRSGTGASVGRSPRRRTATSSSICLDGNASADDAGRARYQILTTLCTGCKQAWQHGGGRDLPVSATDLAIAECDAQRVGSDREPGTAVQDVAPKVRRFVANRDRRRCTVPGCRAARHIDVHHIRPRHLGGGHEPENLTLLCSGHHRALHEGHLIITGRAPDLEFVWTNDVIEADAADVDTTGVIDANAVDVGTTGVATPGVGGEGMGGANHCAHRLLSPHVGPDEGCDGIDRSTTLLVARKRASEPSNYEWIVKKTEVIAAMKQMGFSKQEARALVEQAAGELPRTASHDDLVRRALRIYRHSPAGASLVR